MYRIESSMQIKATPEQVWALANDVKRYPEWVVPTDRVVEAPAGGLSLGAVYREYGGIAPFKSESRWEVMEFEPVRRQVHEGDDGKMRMRLTISLRPSEGGTFVTQGVELTPRWFLLPLSLVMWPLLMRRRGNAAMRETLANAKRILEGGTG